MLNKILQAEENDTSQKYTTTWKSENERAPEKSKQGKCIYHSYRIKRTIIGQK